MMMMTIISVAFLIITAATFAEAKFYAKYAVGKEDLLQEWVEGPSFRIPDQQCNGFLDLTDRNILKKLCGDGDWWGRAVRPVALEVTCRDQHAYPALSVDGGVRGVTAWRAACEGEGVVSTRVQCPIRRPLPQHSRRVVSAAAVLPQDTSEDLQLLPLAPAYIQPPIAPEYIQPPRIDYYNSLNQLRM